MRTKNSLLHSYNVLLREYNFYFIVYMYILSGAVFSIAIAWGVICNYFSVQCQLRFYFTFSITKAVINYSYK